MFNSRINLNLREAHGYTYGAFSAFEWRRQAGPFVVSTAVKSDITDAAAREMLIEIDRIRAEAIAPDELSLATSYLDGVFPIRFETTSAIAAALAVLVVHGLPEDYYDQYRERVRGDDDRADSARRRSDICIPTRCRWWSSAIRPSCADRSSSSDLARSRCTTPREIRRRMTRRTTATEAASSRARERSAAGGSTRAESSLSTPTPCGFPTDRSASWTWFVIPGASAVVPFLSDPRGDDPQILLLKQYRYAAEQYLYEIPAGRLEPGRRPDALRQPESCAKRPAARPSTIEFLFTMYTTPGFTDERIHRLHGNRTRAWRNRT